MSPLPPGNPPRPFLFKLLNYKDRDAILYKARTKGSALSMDSSKVSLFPDFSVELQKQCAKFTEIKKRLRDLNLQYAMLYPSLLRVVTQGEVHFFDRPSLVTQWLDREERLLAQPTPEGCKRLLPQLV